MFFFRNIFALISRNPLFLFFDRVSLTLRLQCTSRIKSKVQAGLMPTAVRRT